MILMNFLRILLFFLLGLTLVGSFQLQVFRDLNYRGLIYEEEEASEVGCHNLKPYARGIAGSVKLNRCVIAYDSPDCHGRSIKLQPATDTLTSLMKPFYSYSACNASYGGSKIRVDLFNDRNELLTEYGNICGCQDLPTQVSSAAARLHNYGNCVKVYQTDACDGAGKEILGGRNDDSEDLRTFGHYVRSISACGSRPSCVKLHSQVYKFVLFPDAKTLKALEDNSKKVELAAKTTFYNNGSATVIQTYHASKSVKEIFSVKRSRAITLMDSSTVEKTVETEVKVNLLFVSVSVKTTLREAYTMENTKEQTEEETYTREEAKTFAVTQTISIPECAQYQVSSIVTIIENMEIPYEVYTKVTGTSSGRRLTAREVQAQVSEMTYVEDLDEFTAVFMSKHSLFASVGVDTEIYGEGSDIPGCTPRSTCPVGDFPTGIY